MKVELLAPAGSFEGMKAVIDAGADAVYIGGQQFGARAYADNPDTEKLLLAIDYVHIHGKKLYLTVNTLLKNQELYEQLHEYMNPLYEAGADGVIVQDMGVLRYIRRNFPKLPVHASTQMAVTGAEGAVFLESLGISRIVPARELSLEEIRNIRNASRIEIECFIHGAMCYSYSGMCLFSSLLGGRSGNRGRCAQPCRLPYTVNKRTSHLLSLKDMCTVSLLPEIIEAGVTSLKIEGRMKKPEYAAGVTRIYRKYLDQYYKKQNSYRVSKDDYQELKDLYHRDGFSQGYYQIHNGSEMIAIQNEKRSADQSGNKKAVGTSKQENINGVLVLTPESPAVLKLSMGEYEVRIPGAIVQRAQNQPLTEAQIRTQMTKTGNTPFHFVQLNIKMDPDVFLPVQSLNALRRQGLKELEKTITDSFHRSAPEEDRSERMPVLTEKTEISMNASVETREQFFEVLKHPSVDAVYYNFQLLQKEHIVESLLSCIRAAKDNGKKFYISLPWIVRGDQLKQHGDSLVQLKQNGLDGFLVRNPESFACLKNLGLEGKTVIDFSLYSFNDEAVQFWKEQGAARQTIPIELNQREIRNRDNTDSEMLIYGYLPMMVSSQCIRKTLGSCDHRSSRIQLKDRYGKRFLVQCVCNSCYTIMYNSIPLGLIKEYSEVKDLGIRSVRLAFTIEDAKETGKMIDIFTNVYKNHQGLPCDVPDFTKGHFKRGVK